MEAEAPVKMEMKNKQGKAKVVEVKPVEISLIHTDYFETKESSEYSDFTEEQMSSTIPREIRQKKTPQKQESPKKQTQKTPQKRESPKKQTQKTPKIEPEFESSDEEKQPRTVLSSHSGIDPEALSEGSDEEEFTSAFELPPKITPLDASAQKDVIESVLDFEEEEEPAEQTSFDLSPMPSPTPKGKKKQQPKQETYEYEYEYEYYSDAPSKSSPEKSSHRKTPKSTPKPAPKASPKPAPSMPTRNSPKGTVLSSAKHINRHRAEDTKAVFLSESEGSPNKSSEVVVTKKKQEIDYDKLAKEKLRKEFDFVFDEEEDKQETTESVHIEPMYTSESGAYATDFSISSISAESSQVAPKQKKMSFQIAKGPTAVSIEPQKEMQQSRSPQKGERQSSNQNRSPQKEPRSSDVPRAVPANPQREMPQSKYINAEMSRQAIAPMKPQKEIPPARNLDAEMARQAAALTKQPKKSKPRNSTLMEADLEEWEDDFSRDAPPSPNSPPRKTPEKRERPRVQVPMLDSGSDDEFERDYAVDDFPGDSPMMSSSPLDERFVPKKKLRQTFYESPKAPKAAAPAEDDMMSTDPEPMPKPTSKKSAAVAFLGRLFGKR